MGLSPKLGVLLLIILNFSVIHCLKCYFCSVNEDGGKLHQSCHRPAQWRCVHPTDKCIALIVHNSQIKRCVRADDQQFTSRCEEARRSYKDNCRYCTADLCNSAKKKSEKSNIALSLLMVAFNLYFYFSYSV